MSSARPKAPWRIMQAQFLPCRVVPISSTLAVEFLKGSLRYAAIAGSAEVEVEVAVKEVEVEGC